MNFDLTGLFQRQTQIPVTDSSAQAVQSGAGHGTNTGSAMNLSVGTIVSGQVISAEGDMVQVEISPGNILQAKVEDGLALLKGMSVSFEVSGVSDKQVALRALFQNTAGMATINKALEAAELPVTAETTSMVNAMMKEGMPIDKASLLSVYRQVSAHSGVNPQDIVTMNRLEIPVTEANIKQFSDYMNMEHQIRGSVETIADSMSNTLGQLVADGKVAEAAQLMRQMTDIFMQTAGDGTADSVMPGTTSGIVPEQTGQPADGAQLLTNESGKVVIQDPSVANPAAGASLEELMRAVTDDGGAQNADPVQTKMQQLMTEMEHLGLPAEKTQQFLQGQLSGKELLEFANQLLDKMAQSGNSLGHSGLDALAELMQRPDMQNALKAQIFEQWLMTPEDVADKQKVSDFYAKLHDQSGRLADALKQIPGADQNLASQVNNVHQNIDFMNQLNQTMSYVQLPLKLAGENAHGDLYVYTNKRNLADNDGNVSAFLHLDMDHLGPVDVYVAMQQQKVSTQFYLQDDEMLEFIHANIGLLNERLESKGYQMNAQFSVKEKPGNVMEEIVEDHRENMKIGTFSFDMRA